MKGRYDRVIFEAGGRDWTWLDALVSAAVRGDFARLIEDTRFGLACGAELTARGEGVSDTAVKAAAKAFRMRRGLAAAKDMQAWLEEWGLSADAWMGGVRRMGMRENLASERAALLALHPLQDAEVAAALQADAVCSGELAQYARRLAALVAIELRERGETPLEPGADEEDAGGELQPEQLELMERWLSEVDREDVRRRATAFARAEAVFVRARDAAALPEAIEAHLRSNHTEWIYGAWRMVSFPRADMAEEAMLCVRSDGMDLAEVAGESKVPLVERKEYLKSTEESLRVPLLGAKGGELLGPLRIDDRFVVVEVVEKVLPSAADPELARRVGQKLWYGVIDLEVARRIRWRIRV